MHYMLMVDCKELVRNIAWELTGEEPKVEVTEDEYGAIIDVTVTGKISKLIGKNGSTIDAIRTVVKSIGYNNLHRVKVQIHEQRNTA